MDELYEQVLTYLEGIVDEFARRVPQPTFVERKNVCGFRHVEKIIHQAIVQKMVRMVSTLHATRLLLNHGFVQEQASLQRILDEIQEDIAFLVLGIIQREQESSLHCRYLETFFEEEFDADTTMASTQKRHIVPRQKIHAYLARTGFSPTDPSSGVELLRTTSKAYSGYIHAASPHIMDMYGGHPPRFHMRGMVGSSTYEAYRDDLWNYFFRGISACGLAAKAFGDEKLFGEIRGFLRKFECVSNRDYSQT